jgi:glycosyltransferase involved in cell wall biosynthesis
VIKVIQVITGLNTGGTEMMLYKLLSGIDRRRFFPAVISLTDEGPVGIRIKQLGIPVETVGMHSGRPSIMAIRALRRLIRQHQPGIIQGWLPHGNLASLIGGINLCHQIPVLWNIRQSLNTLGNLADSKRSTNLTIKVGAKLSWVPRFIIYNNKTGRKEHEAIGYRVEKGRVIPNGFDTEQFKPMPNARIELKKELGIHESAMLIGLIARYHPMKDHGNFLRAASLTLRETPNAHFILAGQDVDRTNSELAGTIDDLGISANVHLLGERKDIAKINASLDIAVSSSRSEGFANVIGEAMACGTVCVVTDVGDSAWIIGDTGRVVPSQDPAALAAAMLKILNMDENKRKMLGDAARQRVISEFSLDKVVQSYENLYLEALHEQ